MPALLKYPLEQVIEVKKRRVDEAERLVAEKKRQVEREEEKLKQAEEERDKIKRHYQEKLQQLREALDRGTRTDKIQQMRLYLGVVEEKRAQEEDKVKKQKLALDQARVDLEKSQVAWRLAMKEVDKLQQHRKLWTEQMMVEINREEEKEQDELGSIIFLNNQRKHQ